DSMTTWRLLLLKFWGELEPANPHRRESRRRKATIRPQVEPFEARTLPTNVVTWINPLGGDWDTPTNWSTGAVPGPADSVYINLPGITVTHASATADSIKNLASVDAIVLSHGSLALAAPSKVYNTLK